MPYYSGMKTKVMPNMKVNSSTAKTITAINKAIKFFGSDTALAKAVGVTPPTINSWKTGSRPISEKKCVLIEQKTNGLVTRKQLRPFDYAEIWPEIQ